MKASVFDTYVERKDGGVMHFDIVVPTDTPDETVLGFGREYLSAKGQAGQRITTQECTFCHIEDATPAVAADIRAKGYSIIEMQGC